MNSLEAQLSKLVDNLVNGITALARQAALETLETALGGNGTPTSARVAVRVSSVKGAKRDHTEIAATGARVLAFVKANPGARAEQVNVALDTRTKDIALPLKRLIATGAVRIEGKRRWTRYFPR